MAGDKRTLLDITDDMDALDDLLAECGGDVTGVEDYVDRLFESLDSEMSSKVDNYAALIEILKDRAKGRKEQADRLLRRSKVDSSSAAFLAAKLKGELERRGMKKIETDRFKVTVAGNGGKRPLDLHDEVPDEWCKEIPARMEPDKDRIREHLETGESLDFAILQERGTRLSLR